jgi:hypothetical protein
VPAIKLAGSAAQYSCGSTGSPDASGGSFCSYPERRHLQAPQQVKRLRPIASPRIAEEESFGAKRIYRSLRSDGLGFLPKVSYFIQLRRLELCPNNRLAQGTEMDERIISPKRRSARRFDPALFFAAKILQSIARAKSSRFARG